MVLLLWPACTLNLSTQGHFISSLKLGAATWTVSLLSFTFLFTLPLLDLFVWGHGHADMFIMDILSVRSLDGGVFYL